MVPGYFHHTAHHTTFVLFLVLMRCDYICGLKVVLDADSRQNQYVKQFVCCAASVNELYVKMSKTCSAKQAQSTICHSCFSLDFTSEQSV